MADTLRQLFFFQPQPKFIGADIGWIGKDGRNVLRTPSLAETVMQPPDFPYTKQDLKLQENNLPYITGKAHWPTAAATDGEKGGPNIACEKIGRQARLIELDPKYCDVIVKRWEAFTGKTAVRNQAASIEQQS